jgi:hypothetical protein
MNSTIDSPDMQYFFQTFDTSILILYFKTTLSYTLSKNIILLLTTYFKHIHYK